MNKFINDKMSMGDPDFILYQSEKCANNVVANADKMTPETSYLNLPKSTHSAFVVGPDSALSHSDSISICPMSSLNNTLDKGLTPTYVVCRDIDKVDLSKVPESSILVVDVQAHPENWREGAVWFIPASTLLMGLACNLRHRPLYAGPSDLTAAVALAGALGAECVELTGSPRSFVGLDNTRVSETETLDFLETLNGKYYGTINGNIVPLVGIYGLDKSPRYSKVETMMESFWLEEFASKHFGQCLYDGFETEIPMAGWSPKVPKILVNQVKPTAKAVLEKQGVLGSLIGKSIIYGLELPSSVEYGTDLVDFLNAKSVLGLRQGIKDPCVSISILSRLQMETSETLLDKSKKEES